jgi:hypothetical protein
VPRGTPLAPSSCSGPVSHRRVRVGLRAEPPLRSRARVRVATTTRCPPDERAQRARDDGRGRSRSWRQRRRRSRAFSGSTTTTARALRSARAVSQRVHGEIRISAKSRSWTSRAAAWSRRSAGAAGPIGRRHRPAITARARRARRGEHGRLLYQSTMHVPLDLRARRRREASSDTPSARAACIHTILDWAGSAPSTACAGRTTRPTVLGEGDEAVPRVRLAAAGDGGARALQGDPRRHDRDLRSAGGSGRDAQISDRVRCRRHAQGDGGLSRAVAGRRARARRISTRREAAGWPRSATSARRRRRSSARTRRGRPT